MFVNVRKNNLSLFCRALCRYTVMSGTPEKILEHLLETIKLDSNGNDAIGGCLASLLSDSR